MRLAHLYRLILKHGIEADPRKDKVSIRSFSDSAILYGDPGIEVTSVLVGIDIEVPEIILADRLREAQGVDMVFAHHPGGGAYAALYEVLQLQVDLLTQAGVPQKVAEAFLEERKREVERKILPANHMRSVDAARLLNIPFVCAHTPADNQAHQFINRLLLKERPPTLEHIVRLLMNIPEYAEAARNNAGPRVILGNPRRTVGKWFVEMTGGTEGHKDVYDKLYKTGVRTIISMHLGEDHFKKAKDAGLNVVIAGHISSDTLGLNLLLDKIENEEKLDIICCSGFRRFRRSKGSKGM
ncbi:MAG: NGG1p interacting factor NIF3 [Candidatus Omnitrophota bacterium]|jgi:putative NIF3 family GTP cyclohydrolase 1 type 2